jgi:hypothetical protein
MIEWHRQHSDWSPELDLTEFIYAVLHAIDQANNSAHDESTRLIDCYFSGAMEDLGVSGMGRRCSQGGCGNAIGNELLRAKGIRPEGLPTLQKYAYHAGFDEMMDWLSRPEEFSPSRLARLLEQISA